MSVQDVFAAPKSSVRDVSGGSGVITDSIVAAMRKTRPWVLFLAILGFIGAALTGFGGIAVLFSAIMLGRMDGMDTGDMAPFGSGMMLGMGVLYIVSAVIYFMASWYLLKYAGAIKRLLASLSVAELETALNQQASFWKLMGILALLTIVLLLVMLVAGGSALFMGASGM